MPGGELVGLQHGTEYGTDRMEQLSSSRIRGITPTNVLPSRAFVVRLQTTVAYFRSLVKILYRRGSSVQEDVPALAN